MEEAPLKQQISLIGGFGNTLFQIALGRHLRDDLGREITFVPFKNTFHEGNPVISVVDESYDEIPFKKVMYVPYWDSYTNMIRSMDKENFLITGLFQFPFFMDRLIIPIDPPDDCIGVHIRRGDYIGNCNFLDLCSTDYYSKALKALPNKPIKIFTDEAETIPSDIKEIFKDAEIISTDTLSDFKAYSACNYKIVSNSTFATWAAYMNPNSVCTCYYGNKGDHPFNQNIKTIYKPEWLKIK